MICEDGVRACVAAVGEHILARNPALAIKVSALTALSVLGRDKEAASKAAKMCPYQ